MAARPTVSKGPTSPNEALASLGRGERAPDFVLPSDGIATRFYGCAGGVPTVLVFPPPDSELEDSALAELSHWTTFVVSRREPGTRLGSGTRTFLDADGTVSAAYGVLEAKGRVLVLDPSLRVLLARDVEDAIPNGLGSWVRHAVTELPWVEPGVLLSQAPVLLVPRVLDRELCSRLAEVWRTGGHEETGVEASIDRERVLAIREDLKRRQDHTVTDDGLMKMLVRVVGRRVIPEVRRAFAFPATRFEGFKIVRYDASTGGFFRAHRDNLSPATAHRRFALSLNLNEGYEGGEISFPEYGPMRYRPAAGEALLFSCSLLHEVTEVTSGERLALLSFLFGEGDVRPGTTLPRAEPPAG